MDDRRWSVVCGPWSVVRGLWSVYPYIPLSLFLSRFMLETRVEPPPSALKSSCCNIPDVGL
jgi:hypothetical protein